MPNILVVEDDAQIRAMLRETLETEGYSVVVAADGVEALAKYRSHEIDLIVTDILMPKKEGLTLITELRRSNPHIKIIAISGGAPGLQSSCNLELARMFGAQQTFSKPLDIDALLECIEELLDASPSEK
jgi:CheY-like chemotaxis protein